MLRLELLLFGVYLLFAWPLAFKFGVTAFLLPYAVLMIIYLWMTRPLNHVRLLGDIGFDLRDAKNDSFKERNMERLKRMRIKGELPPVFPNSWFCVGESALLKKGDVQQIAALGKLLVMVRTEQGKVHIVDSYCPHLGANLAVGGRMVNGNCLQCPFHGWKFDVSTGKCVEIPYDQGRIPDQAKIDTYHAVERNEHIYLWHHAEGLDPHWEVPGVGEMYTEKWEFCGRTEHEIACHIQEVPENGSDIAHLGYLHHPGPNEGSNILSLDLSNVFPFIRHVWDGRWAVKEGEPHIGVLHLDQHLEFKGWRLPLTSSKLVAEQIGPGLVYMHFDFGFWGRGVVFQHVTPEEPLQQRVRFRFYSNINRFFCKFFLKSEALQFERDIYVWCNKKFIKNPVLVRNDGPIGKFRRWFLQFYSENSPRLLVNGTLSTQDSTSLSSVNDW